MKNYFCKGIALAFSLVALLFVSALLAMAVGCSPWPIAAVLAIGSAVVSQSKTAGLLQATLLPTTALLKVNLQTEDAFSTTQRMLDNDLHADSLQKQIEKQDALGPAFIQKLTDPKKDNADVRVIWVDFCGDAAEDCTSDNYCAGIDSAVQGIDYKDYNITQCVTDDFKVSESTFAGSFQDLQDFVVLNQKQKIINLVNRLNMKYLISLHANAGYNRGGTYTINGTTGVSEIPAANYNSTDLITDLIIDAKISKIARPFILDSRNLMKTFLNAGFDENNLDGKGNAVRKNYFDVTFDPFGFADAGTSVANSTFMVTPYAEYFVSKNYYQNAVPQAERAAGGLDIEKYFIRIPALGISVDVLHQRICESLKKDRYAHVWKYTLNYDFLTNPYGCADGGGHRVSGIIEYKKV